MRFTMNTHKRMNTVFALIESFLLMGLLFGVATTGYSEQSITYIYTDHRGSPIKAINPTTAETWTEDYQPYSTKRLNQDGDNSVGYTGHRHEKSLNVTYMQGRWYHPGMGRFLALDPVRFVGGTPASFNRYAYANNNPYKYVDPDGRWAEDAILGLPSIVIGAQSFSSNVAEGNYGGAAVDLAGMAYDVVASATPGVPGVAGITIKAGREAAEQVTSNAARREAMRRGGIPTSQQPISQSSNASGSEYTYETIKSGGGSEIKSVQQQTLDSSHKGQGHWEAGSVKTDPITGEIRMNEYGRPKLTNEKSKVDYNVD